MVEIKLLCFSWLSLFFKGVQKGVPVIANLQSNLSVNVVSAFPLQ